MAPKTVLGVVLLVILALAPIATAEGKPACNDGKDNDGDGLVDMNDPGCESKSDKSEENGATPPGPTPKPACSDGTDNDRDGRSDYPSDIGCGSPTDVDEFNVTAHTRYLQRLDPSLQDLDIQWVPPDAEPTSEARPTGTDPAERLVLPRAGPRWYGGPGGGYWDVSTNEAAAFITAEVWADVGPGALGQSLQLYWGAGQICAGDTPTCWPGIDSGPITLQYVAGTGQTLPDGSVLGGNFRADSVPAGTCYLGGYTEFCHLSMTLMEIRSPTGAGIILYDGAATPSCVGINIDSC